MTNTREKELKLKNRRVSYRQTNGETERWRREIVEGEEERELGCVNYVYEKMKKKKKKKEARHLIM